MEEYSALASGMTLADALTILGRDGEQIADSDVAGYHTSMYQWGGCSGAGANMNVTFQDGKVVSKAQSGLRSDGKAAVMPTTTTTAQAPTSAQILADPGRLQRALDFMTSGDCRSLGLKHDIAVEWSKTQTPRGR